MSLLDTSEKKILLITGVVMVVMILSMLFSRGKYNDVPECLPYDKAYETAKVVQVDEKTYQVYSVAQMWQFEPAEIYIPTGSEVDFYVTSKDVVHGFNIAEKNINLMAVYGNINKVTVKFDKPGVYPIVCHEYCGVGHQNMMSNVYVGTPANSQKASLK